MSKKNKQTKHPIDDNLMKDYYDVNNWQKYYKQDIPKPPLVFDLEGQEVTVYGGSCHEPKIKDADVYVSLDRDPPVYDWEQPWFEDQGKKHIRFSIKDMSVPLNTKNFKAFINFVKNNINAGKKVHIGCIGGNGRTGMVLSALIQTSMGDNIFDKKGNKIGAIDYVRDNYSTLAVETVPQILFLHYNFGIKIPQENKPEIVRFLTSFEEKVGIPLDDIIQKGVDFDEVTPLLKEVESYMFSKLKFSYNNGKPSFKPAALVSSITKPTSSVNFYPNKIK